MSVLPMVHPNTEGLVLDRGAQTSAPAPPVGDVYNIERFECYSVVTFMVRRCSSDVCRKLTVNLSNGERLCLRCQHNPQPLLSPSYRAVGRMPRNWRIKILTEEFNEALGDNSCRTCLSESCYVRKYLLRLYKQPT